MTTDIFFYSQLNVAVFHLYLLLKSLTVYHTAGNEDEDEQITTTQMNTKTSESNTEDYFKDLVDIFRASLAEPRTSVASHKSTAADRDGGESKTLGDVTGSACEPDSSSASNEKDLYKPYRPEGSCLPDNRDSSKQETSDTEVPSEAPDVPPCSSRAAGDVGILPPPGFGQSSQQEYPRWSWTNEAVGSQPTSANSHR